ncbi:DUF2914 domain-containing protein [Desulfamplus magnetovallimortis]|nr:DUF2914 domain-containing protein [Desulfamplus magnetovallimortis]
MKKDVQLEFSRIRPTIAGCFEMGKLFKTHSLNSLLIKRDYILYATIFLLILLFFSATSNLYAEEETNGKNATDIKLKLTKAVMCEYIKDFEPANTAVVFPISFGKIHCYTAFEEISENTFIYHKWFHKDRFVATNRFHIKSPQWSTFSTMQLRVADKGPWRVEITDDNDKILKTLRFSVSD